MKTQSSSRKSYRLLFAAWLLGGVAAIAATRSPQYRALERNQQAAGTFTSVLKSVEQARLSSLTPDADPNLRNSLLNRAMQDSLACIQLLENDHPNALLAARVQQNLIALESGRCFDALGDLLNLAEADRPSAGAEWTENTPLIEAAVAETRYKIALMCKDEGDGFENWSRYAEAAARGYQDLADHATTAAEKKQHLHNLAVCTRLIYGKDETHHSLGFPACRTTDCALVARVWKRIPPPKGGGRADKKNDGSPDGIPWVEPPPPTESTQGR